MAQSAQATHHVVVAGDVTVDWNLARSGEQSAYAYWSSGRQTKASRQAGGAALLGAVVERMVRDCFLPGVKVWHPGVDPNYQGRPGEDCCASFSVWAKFPKTDRQGEPRAIWRVEEYLGADPAAAVTRKHPDGAPPEGCDLVILDDAGLGFCEQPAAWPAAIAPGASPWILLKMSAWQNDQGAFRHLATGSLFDHLHQHHADRLVVLVNANDLRLRDAGVSRDISWEQTAQDLAHELLNNPSLARLADCAHVVVRLSAAGVFLYSRNAGAPDCLLFYDPAEMGDSWERRYPGGVIGYTVCLAAALARHLLQKPADRDWKITIQRGIGALRKLHLQGYKYVSGSPQGVLEFPYDDVVAEIQRPAPLQKDDAWPGTELCETPVPLDRASRGQAAGAWTILGARYPDALGLAEEVVRQGPDMALRLNEKSKILSVPMARFGAMKTVDRQEIENLRSIGRLVREYCSQSSQTPLSFAVFGPPGCGKSFAIEQLATDMIPGNTKKLTFNLSQFSSPAELGEAFHQVRDSALRGEMPLVFWDEFDANLTGQPLGWLKYFLAPMQDGCFQAGPLTHPVGRAIFAFAGSVCSTMQAFEEHVARKAPPDAKGKDFISRLKGFVNILGPDRQVEDGDPHYVLRRALILRGTLERERPLLFDDHGVLRIDAGVLRALLFVSRYRHGVRSLASVIAMSVLHGKLKFERSCLPPAAQLDLHVDAAEFLALTNGVQFAGLDAATVERMARETHAAFFEYLKKEGYRFGGQNDDEAKTHTCCVEDFGGLTGEHQEDNRKFVRAIPNRLVPAGCVIGALPIGEKPGDLAPDAIESMAEMEHERWMWSKLAAGHRYGAPTQKDKRIHSCLLTWRKMTDAERRLRYGAWAGAIGEPELPDTEKEKDRILIRAIPRILKTAGLQVTPIPRSQPEYPDSELR
jgi:hypothetical protein